MFINTKLKVRLKEVRFLPYLATLCFMGYITNYIVGGTYISDMLMTAISMTHFASLLLSRSNPYTRMDDSPMNTVIQTEKNTHSRSLSNAYTDIL